MMNTSAPESATPRYTWSEVWTAVLTRPSVQTFEEILRDPAATRQRAMRWITLTWIVYALFVGILTLGEVSNLSVMPRGMNLSPSELRASMTTGLMCALPLLVLLGVLAFRLLVWAVQFVARRLVGESKNEQGAQVAYTFASIQAPLNVLSLLFAALPASPILSLVSLAATIYQFYLMSLAVRTVYGVSGGRSAAIIALTFLLLLMVVVALSVLIVLVLRLLAG